MVGDRISVAVSSWARWLSLLLIAAIPGGSGVAQEPVEAIPKSYDLSRYRALWEDSLFGRPAGEPPVAAPRPNMSLIGWGAIGTSKFAYVYDRDAGKTIEVKEGTVSSMAVMQLLQILPESNGIGLRALVSWKGEKFWVETPSPSSSAAPQIRHFKVPEAGQEVKAPETIDSRAAELTGPVILNESVTMEQLISKGGTQSAEAARKANSARLELLRARHRELVEIYGSKQRSSP
jgi:hypothetical protein